MSLALYRVPDGQREKGQSVLPCPSVYSPAPALGSLSSVALSSVQVPLTLAQTRAASANYCPVLDKLSSGFLVEATNHVSSGFLREATGLFCSLVLMQLKLEVQSSASRLLIIRRKQSMNSKLHQLLCVLDIQRQHIIKRANDRAFDGLRKLQVLQIER